MAGSGSSLATCAALRSPDAVGNERVLVTGDRDLLFDAVGNLVDHAIKYGREAGRVSVAVKQSDGTPVISVADDGPGIPAGEYLDARAAQARDGGHQGEPCQFRTFS